MEKKLIFFDIDGTLLDQEKKMPQSTKQAIRSLQDKGHILAIATGRAPFMFKDLREMLDIRTFVSMNGSYVVHEGNLVYDHPLDFDELHQFAQFAESRKHPIIFEQGEQMYINTQETFLVEEAIGALNVKKDAIFAPNSYKWEKTYQSILFCTEVDDDLYREKFEKFEFVRFHDNAIDVVPVGGSKAKGIEAVMEHMQIPVEHVYAFGDALNDIEMLSFVHNSVAMGNALEEVKQVAKYVTSSVEEDGILKGLELVGLL